MKNHLPQETTDVLIIGAGPAGSLASVLLQQKGIRALVIEKQQFPRFSIGESLLPQSMVYLDKANMLDALKSPNFQFKNGAAFQKGGKYTDFNFEQKFSKGPGTTFQVKRAEFDHNLAKEAMKQGVEIRFEHEVLDVNPDASEPCVRIASKSGEEYQVKAKYILDASGFGRVLPRLLELETPSDFPTRKSIFCHIEDGIEDSNFDRNKILISVHPEYSDIWYWLIPFANGSCSLGVVAEPKLIDSIDLSSKEKLLHFVGQVPELEGLLSNAAITTPVQEITGYSANVKSLYGPGYALLGNAGEFLDPVFSSGVTIAFKSADLATNLLAKQLSGEAVCWQTQYAEPLMQGVNTFRTFVTAWYDRRFQDIIFYDDASENIREKVCSILAGYAWDMDNPYVADSERRIGVLAEICQPA